MSAASALAGYRFGRFELQPGERLLLDSGAPVHVGPHAFDLLAVLVERNGRLVTKDELLALVWPKVIVEENTLQVHVSALRKILGADAIATVPGHGYRFTPEVTPLRAAAAVAPTAPGNNLPYDLTSFVGREKQLAELAHSLRSARLITLTGAGGCGKTRLGIRFARQQSMAFPDGVWLVELAALSEAALLPQALASVLGIKERAGSPLVDTITEFLSSRVVLLVLDNAEHLVDACANLVETLLRRCERLTILATSRERLSITGELIYRVPSLTVPGNDREVAAASLANYEAPRLFIERVKLQVPDFEVTEPNVPSIAAICRRLDGIALALELAAAAVRTLPVEEVARRLDSRFELLTQGPRTALPRHRTLRALIDWSCERLEEGEKAMMRRLSVFSGGWELDAAQHVSSGGPVDPANTLALLTSLADKSLVLAETREGVTRYGMLETVRQYASERSRESGEEADVRSRHVGFFVDLALDLQNPQSDDERRPKLARLARDHDNLRSALAWCAETGRNEAGLRLTTRLSWHWRTSGRFTEGRGWFARFLASAPDDYPPEERTRALMHAGILAHLQGDDAASETLHGGALALAREAGDAFVVSAELHNLGNIAYGRGDYAAARALYEEAVVISRERGDHRSTGGTLLMLGVVAWSAGDFARAETLLEECAEVNREVGSWSVARARGWLGRVKHAQGDTRAARVLLTEGLEGERMFYNREGIARTLSWLAALSHDDSDIPAAKSQAQEALAIQRDLGNRGDNLVTTVETFAGLCVDLADPSAAARLWGVAEQLRDVIGAGHAYPERTRRDRLVAAARAALNDDAAFDQAWRDGRSWSLDEAVRYAIAK